MINLGVAAQFFISIDIAHFLRSIWFVWLIIIDTLLFHMIFLFNSLFRVSAGWKIIELYANVVRDIKKRWEGVSNQSTL